jgi:hypothetical protein
VCIAGVAAGRSHPFGGRERFVACGRGGGYADDRWALGLWAVDCGLHGTAVRPASRAAIGAVGKSVQRHRAAQAWVDLFGVDLFGVDLFGVDLFGVDLFGVDLFGVDLFGVDLFGVDLFGVDLFAYSQAVNGCRHDGWPLSAGWMCRLAA